MLVDDAGYADFGFAGCKDLKTPHIDQLANDGVIFTDAHVTASVCGPSRAGLITGRYQQRFGFECNPNIDGAISLDEKTIADAMKAAGYTTAAFGKWHLGATEGYIPNDRGFDYFYGFLSGSRNYFWNKKQDATLTHQSLRENNTQVSFEGYLTDDLSLKTVDFIERNKEKPFFIYWSPNAVHTPMQATKEDLALFEGHPRQTLAAMTWALDRAVGRICQKLKEEGIYDNTLIFFLSDNGGSHLNQSSNYPLKGYKGNKYEGGIRVPFIVSYPKAFGHHTFDGLTSSLDIFASCMDVGNNTNHENFPCDGVSLLPFLTKEKKGNPHQELYWRKDAKAAARIGDLKLIRVENLGYRLYNLKENLGEDIDLQTQQQAEFIKLKDALESWETQMIAPLWTEGAVWDTITYMIHEDYFNNREPHIKDPWSLKKEKK